MVGQRVLLSQSAVSSPTTQALCLPDAQPNLGQHVKYQMSMCMWRSQRLNDNRRLTVGFQQHWGLGKRTSVSGLRARSKMYDMRLSKPCDARKLT